MALPHEYQRDVTVDEERTLRLLWPQWQGAGVSSVRSLASEFPFDVARRGYAVGSAVLEAVLPEHVGPTARVPVELGDRGLEKVDGIEAKSVVVEQLGAALEIIRRYDPARIVTLGGECSVSVAPFSELAARDRVALVGLHSWEEDDYPHIADWGIRSFSPDDLRHSSQPMLDWLAATGCTRLAIHFDVDTVDSNEIVLGLGAEPDGLRSAEAHRVVTDAAAAADGVGFTVAEFFPRQVMHLQSILQGLPLIER